MTEPLLAAFDRLATSMREIVQDRPIIFFINPGNWGDSLIREGAEQFLRHYEFNYTAVKAKDVQKNRTTVAAEIAKTGHDSPVMVYNGCGAFSRHYETAPRVAALAAGFKTAIVMPSTYAIDMEEYNFPDHTHFFARDRFESLQAMPDAPFCHDMAFFLRFPDKTPTKDVAWFMRGDRETPDNAKPQRGNVDLSRKGRAHTPIDGFIAEISKYRVVHTNRLHVGIGAALLGCETHIYGNDYFKIRAIFDSSIAPYFDNATFHTDPPQPPRKKFFGLF